MIGNDRFVQVFGSVPAGDDTLLTQIVANAVREGFHIVLCAPGTDTPVCTLPRNKTIHRDHECGTAHALSLENLLGPPEEFTFHNSRERAKVRAKVQAIVNRVAKQHGAKPNIGVLPGPSGYAVVTYVPPDEPPVFPTVRNGRWDRRWYWFQLPDGMTLPDRTADRALVPPSTTKYGALELIGQTSPAPAWLLERITQP